MVDACVKTEAHRLRWLRYHQKELRVESYVGLGDYLNRQANENAGPVGRHFVLPSTFTGSPRNMIQNYQEAMAIVS